MPDTQISESISLISSRLERLLAAVHADDPKREMLVRVGDLICDVRSLEAALSCYVVVPRAPTAAMRIAGAHIHDQRPSEVASIYRAMIQAAPPVPEPNPDAGAS